jgi:hypothetical protein
MPLAVISDRPGASLLGKLLMKLRDEWRKAGDESFHRIRNAEDFSALLAKCGERALAVFEERLQISKRLDLSDGLRELFLKK